MEDFFADLHDEEPEGEEPSFSLHEFRKWLSKQKRDKRNDKPSESIQQDKKEDLKAKFKERIKDKMNKRKEDKD